MSRQRRGGRWRWVRKREAHEPVRGAPSDAAGRTDLDGPVAFAARAAGADGVIIETHPNRAMARSDGDQSLTLPSFTSLRKLLAPFAAAAGRTIASPTSENAYVVAGAAS